MRDETIELGQLCADNNTDDNRSRWHSSDDALAELTGSGPGRGELGQDPRRGPVLEVALAWGTSLLEVRHTERGEFKVGEQPGELFAPLDKLPEPGFTMFGQDDRGAWARVRASWPATLNHEGKRQDVAPLIHAGLAEHEDDDLYRVSLPEGVQLVVDVGSVTFIARRVSAGQRIAARRERAEPAMLGIGAFTAFLGGMLAFVALSQPPKVETELIDIPDRIAQVLIEAPPPAPIEKVKPAPARSEEGARAKREEGKSGKRDGTMAVARGRNLEQLAADKQVAEEAGVLGFLNSSGALDGLMGDAGLNADITGGIGGLIGAKGVQRGSGLGSRGSGFGGGGDAVSIGGLGTKGVGGGDRDYGSDGGRLEGKRDGDPPHKGGATIEVGSLDKAQVDAVIKRAMARFRYCYQRELTRDPTLTGKVSLKFVIARDGSVSSASVKATSLNNEATETCMVNVVRTLTFPEPRGGGLVMVSYPFLFAPG